MENHFNYILECPGLNHIAIKIFSFVDLPSLFNCLIVSKLWHHFIMEQRRVWNGKLENIRKGIANNLHLRTKFPYERRNPERIRSLEKKSISNIVNFLREVYECSKEITLYKACKYENVQVVQLLYEIRRMKLELHEKDFDAKTILQIALVSKNQDINRILCQGLFDRESVSKSRGPSKT